MLVVWPLNLFDWGLTSLLTHQNRSYRHSETKENIEVPKKEAERGKRQQEVQRQLKINTTKKGKKQLIIVWSLVYNLYDLSGLPGTWKFQPTWLLRSTKHTSPTPYHDKVLTTGEIWPLKFEIIPKSRSFSPLCSFWVLFCFPRLRFDLISCGAQAALSPETFC